MADAMPCPTPLLPPPRISKPSLRDLVREHGGLVRRAAHQYGARDSADEVAQVVFITLWHYLQKHDPAQCLQGWLRTVTRHAVAQHYQEETKWWAERPGPEDIPVAELAPSAQELYAARETSQEVKDVLATLEPSPQEVFVRYEMEGEAMVDIAASQGVPLATAYSRLRQARRDFKAAFEARRRAEKPGTGRRGGGKPRAAFFPFSWGGAPTRAGHKGPNAVAVGFALAALVVIGMGDTALRPIVPEVAVVDHSPSSPAVLASEPSASSPPVLDPPASIRQDAESQRSASVSPDSGARGAHRSSERDLEAARILLDVADRMAAEGREEAVLEALRDYAARAPYDPLPASRAKVESALEKQSSSELDAGAR